MTKDEVVQVAGGVAALLVWEAWLGQTSTVKAGSTVRIVYDALLGLVAISQKLFGFRTAPAEGATQVSIEKREILISASIDKSAAWIEELVCDAIDGKDRGEIIGDITTGIDVLADFKSIGADYAADPQAVERTCLLAGERFARRLFASIKRRAASPEKLPHS